MNHPVVVKAAKLIHAGDIVGAETALASLVETDGDQALVVAMDELPAKDLLAVLRDFDASRESVVNLLVSPEQFARAVVLERRYGDASHERLHGMINSVVFRAGGDPGEFIEAIAALDGGCEVLADYLSDRLESLEHFFRHGTFDFFSEGDDATVGMSDAECLDALSDPEINRPFLEHSEVNDHDWLELSWTLRYDHPEVFRDVLLILRARSNAEALRQGNDEGVARGGSDRPASAAEAEEELAL